MRILYLPVFRASLAYTVAYGRRWSVLEHLLLHELSTSKQSVADLAVAASLPDRLVVEALINLLRAGWIEIRTADEVALFSCTELGRKRATEPRLKAELKRRIRWASLCMDRLTGSWMVAEGLDLIHERDLPADAEKLDALVNVMDPQNGEVRDLLELENDEAFERLEPYSRSPARLYARVVLSLGAVQGLPAEAPLRLKEALLEHQSTSELQYEAFDSDASVSAAASLREDITADNLIVGGTEHLETLIAILKRAKSQVVLHSCFLHPEVLQNLLPHLEAAAARKVRVDLLWGLQVDQEDVQGRQPIARSHKVLEQLSAKARSRVVLSNVSSSSHLKVVVSDSGPDGAWETVIGSCNYLSSWFNLTEVSVRLANPHVAATVLGYLVEAQIPASGSWSALVYRLNGVWSELRRRPGTKASFGTHRVTLLVDQDHYACIRNARDSKSADIVVACDLFGQAAETSVLVPMERASQLGKEVTLLYRRASKSLIEQAAVPNPQLLEQRGLKIRQAENLHGKFMVWGENALAISSFNWLATSVGNRARGAEMGICLEGPDLRQMLVEKMKSQDEAIFRVLAAIRTEPEQQSLPV